MSIVINLLPDTRQVKQRNAHRRRVATTVAVLIWIACGAALGIMGLTLAGLNLASNNLTQSIAGKKAELESKPHIIDALTAQQNLAALPGLYSHRVFMTKFFDAYIKANPQDSVLSGLTVNPDNTLTITGTAGTYASVAKLSQALSAQKTAKLDAAFTNVVITSVSKTDTGVSFTISATFAQEVTSGN